MSVLKIGRIRVKVPTGVKVLSTYSLDELYGEEHSKPDALIVLKKEDETIVAIIEDTGRPELHDFDRLSNVIEDLRRKGLIKPNMIILKIIHHTGLKSGRTLLTSLARSSKVELQECRYRIIDLSPILQKRRVI